MDRVAESREEEQNKEDRGRGKTNQATEGNTETVIETEI